MKLGEALVRRSDAQKRLQQLHGRLRASAVTQEGDRPPEDPAELLEELDRVVGELEGLVLAVNVTNSAARLPSGQSITAALAHRDALALRMAALRATVEAAAETQVRYSRSEVRVVRHVDVGALRREVDALARERRELDTLIQAQNWAEELLES